MVLIGKLDLAVFLFNLSVVSLALREGPVCGSGLCQLVLPPLRLQVVSAAVPHSLQDCVLCPKVALPDLSVSGSMSFPCLQSVSDT